MRNALTFDVEDYFHVEAATRHVHRRDWPKYAPRVEPHTRRLLDLLDTRRVVATFFVLGWVAERHSRLIRDIHDRGHEVACHSYAHRLIYSMGREEFRADAHRAKAVIEDAIGTRIHGYRAPTFSVTRDSLWALDVLADEGFAYDSSVFPIHHDRYGIPDAPRFPHRICLPSGREMLEFPLTTLLVAGLRIPFCGGGYFRLAPYLIIRNGMRWINTREVKPAIVYLHPWEFDPEQPRLPLGRLNAFRHYVNLGATEAKLARMLDDFSFGTAHDVLRDYTTAGATT